MAVKKSRYAYKKHKKNFERDIKEWTGILRDVIDGTPEAALEGMKAAIEIIRDESTELTPIDTGELIASQYTEIKQTGKEIVGKIGYDTSIAPHAFYVHEIPPMINSPSGLHTLPHNPPRASWKFLSLAFENKLDEAIEAMDKAIKKAMKPKRIRKKK